MMFLKALNQITVAIVMRLRHKHYALDSWPSGLRRTLGKRV
jgi:hypothetical protein